MFFHNKSIQRITDFLTSLLEGSEAVVPKNIPASERECWAVLQQVQARCKIEHANDQRFQQLRRALHESIAGIVVVNEEGDITFVSQAWSDMTSLPSKDQLGKNISIFQEAEEFEKGIQLLMKNARIAEKSVGEVTILRKNGEQSTVWLQCVQQKDDNGKPAGFTLIGRDVSAQKMVEQELKKRTAELEVLNDHMLDRELRMKELKEENQRMKNQLNVRLDD